eukprot:TRINITY_DN3700_c0_g3_i9.p1 TRINITY_DN3700_c0_g3~~TRINITY_DN3700_c0_g3_i9.p1  ORF type:complete len:313 (+),score=50.22 TRINITY_DN3700_c0_g3_i9:111-1049(+)
MDKQGNDCKYAWKLGFEDNKPISVIIIGMAGSGKSTLTQRLAAYVKTMNYPSYFINLDPAVSSTGYPSNIDIRDSINYKEVMKQYGLGPNGAILTSLNLFATRFDQVMGFVDKKALELQYIFLDTPGQIEVFNWSASGVIITESFASMYPTVLIYVVDTPRSQNPTTFMSNMLYACSLFYKSKLPIVLVFTKTDIVRHDFAVEWMSDFESFDSACQLNDNYMSSFVQSMGLMIGEFYNNFPCVGVSSFTGEGMEDLFQALQTAALEYESGYKVQLEQSKKVKVFFFEISVSREIQNSSTGFMDSLTVVVLLG